jgi:hypothetical protein
MKYYMGGPMTKRIMELKEITILMPVNNIRISEWEEGRQQRDVEGVKVAAEH